MSIILKKGDVIKFKNQKMVVLRIVDPFHFSLKTITPALDTIYHIENDKPHNIFPMVDVVALDHNELGEINLEITGPRSIINNMEVISE